MPIKSEQKEERSDSSIALILPTYNEASRIERIVRHYNRYGPLTVIDNYSTDETANLARSNGADVHFFSNDGTLQTPEFFQNLKVIVGNKYIVLLSCSELIPDALMKFYFKMAESGETKLVSTVVDSYTCGRKIPLWGGRFKAIDRRIERFFYLPDLDIRKVEIHRPFRLLDPTHELRLERGPDDSYVIKHLRDSDIQTLTLKHLGYAMIEAHQIYLAGRTYTFRSLLKNIMKEAARFLQLHPRDWCFISAREIVARIIMHLITYIRFREINSKIDLEHSRKKSSEFWTELNDQ